MDKAKFEKLKNFTILNKALLFLIRLLILGQKITSEHSLFWIIIHSRNITEAT